MPNILHKKVGDVLCVVTGTGESIPDDEWRGLLATIEGEHGHTGGVVRVLGFAGGVAPKPTQRAQLNQLAGAVPIRVAMITESALMRGVATALSWLGKVQVKGFRRGRLADALAFLCVDRGQAPRFADIEN